MFRARENSCAKKSAPLSSVDEIRRSHHLAPFVRREPGSMSEAGIFHQLPSASRRSGRWPPTLRQHTVSRTPQSGQSVPKKRATILPAPGVSSAMGKVDTKQVVRFGLFEVTLNDRLLTKSGIRIRLQDQP